MNASDVAAELRRRLPGVPTKKLHKLLYYCQGHQLATFDEPLFTDTICAFDMGPVVPRLWWAEKNAQAPIPRAITDEAALNTIGYVVSRYGALSGRDLEVLTHGETPYRLADRNRPSGASVRIDVKWIKGFFRTAGPGGADEDDEALDVAVVSNWVQSIAPTPPDLVDLRRDSREGILVHLGLR